MTTDKAMLKTLVPNFSAEFLLEDDADFTHSNFKAKVDSAGGSRFGMGKVLGAGRSLLP